MALRNGLSSILLLPRGLVTGTVLFGITGHTDTFTRGCLVAVALVGIFGGLIGDLKIELNTETFNSSP